METRSEFRRLSMNSSLCNARIFDDDAWEEDAETNKQQKKTKRDVMDTTIEEGEIVETQETNNIKRESSPPPPTIKTEIKSEFDLSKVKKEPVDFKFDESPFNKELIKKIKLEDTPIKEEPSEDEHKKKDVRKISVKRTIFTRNSPYKRESQMGKNLDAEKRESAKVRLGPPVAKKKNEMEMDPATLARRQKQIEYGKNTIGYDNYVAKVPRDQRGLRDPKTPDKFKKYSRRAFDGLIKQWRLQLHKYDENQS